MSMDRRFESMRKRGYWRLAESEVQPEPEPVVMETAATANREEAYEKVLKRLARLGQVKPLPFGRTYFALADRIHLMFRFSKAHHRHEEIEYFLGVTPQYFERIKALGQGYLVLVLGAADNVVLVSAETFERWVQGLEPSGSGTWPLAFYQSQDKTRLERWVPGQGREEVTALLNDYAGLGRGLKQASAGGGRRSKGPFRVADLLEAGLLKPGDRVYTRHSPEQQASVMDANYVRYQGQRWGYNDWGTQVTGWSAINIYREVILARTGQTLDALRKQLRRERS